MYVSYTKLPDWVSEVMPTPDIQVDFDRSPITPGLIKRTLQKYSSTSSPGADGISYFHLKNFLCTHHFLATVFTNILLSSQNGPPSRYQVEIILIPKEDKLDNPSQTSNFRPIALLSPNCNPTLQKGFLSSINGVIEQTFAICSIVCYSARSSPFHIVSRPKQCLWLKAPSSLNPNHGLGTVSKLGYLLANCHFSSGPV